MKLGLILVTLLAVVYVQAKPILMTSRYEPDEEEMKSITVGYGRRSYLELDLRNAVFGFKGFLAGV